MRIGFGAPVSGAWAAPDSLARFAVEAEAAGYGSLWAFQRLLVPEGSAMEPVYHSVLDPMVALGYAAAVTSRIRLGVAVLNMPYASPAYVAKLAASVDVLSGGRLDLGLGLGWMPEEFALAGATMRGRGARTAEYLEVLRRLWAGGVAEFHGEHYTIPAGRFAPVPVQRPGPPVLLGAGAPRALERAGRLADGWLTSSRADLSRIGEGIAVVRTAAEAAGRDPARVRVVCRGVVRWGPPVTVPEGGGRVPLSGSFDDIRADTAWLAEQGVTELFYDLNWDPLVGAPDVDPMGAAARAEAIMDGLAPGR
jgi:probable F420-dependent oxidoreductase